MQKAQNRPDRFPHVRLRSTLFRPASLSLCSLACVLILVILPPWPAVALWGAQKKRVAIRQDTSPEQRTARAFEKARANPLDLRAFLVQMPKGADLHNHLTGAVYAESWIRAAREDGLCVDLATLSFRPAAPPPGAAAAAAASTAHGSTAAPASCGEGRISAAQAYADQHLYDALIDAFSMRSFVPSSAVSGHDHFFDTFAKFGGTDREHTGEWLDEVATRAASQSEQYLELMQTPAFVHTAAIASEIGWRDDFAQLRAELLARGLREDVAEARGEFDQAEALRGRREHCGESGEAPACRVEIRYLYQVLRALPKESVFAQTLLGFEIASADPRVVGLNFVQPEDAATSMADYALHMKILGFLHSLYPRVHIALHAGELTPGLVPPQGLCCHIRLAIEQAHAERIGHGVDIMYEDRPYELLKEMAARHVLVEVNLTSNDVILGVTGSAHPLPIYLRFRVPVALSTDDEGVSRIDLTHEFVRATETYGLRYADLKQMVRASVAHTFLPGADLWRNPDAFAAITAACMQDAPGTEKPSPGCARFLKSSERARLEWELEKRLRTFESGY
jgi:adenosine deaminase